ncbi:MAG: hypothetical protein DDT32_01427 [Syntrophomonadaceae bacterium]|nr:hypothetical protein [Bacillota bacterium]MBT9147662.1 hypothetical protein [Bacillota bacterium]
MLQVVNRGDAQPHGWRCVLPCAFSCSVWCAWCIKPPATPVGAAFGAVKSAQWFAAMST